MFIENKSRKSKYKNVIRDRKFFDFPFTKRFEWPKKEKKKNWTQFDPLITMWLRKKMSLCYSFGFINNQKEFFFFMQYLDFIFWLDRIIKVIKESN